MKRVYRFALINLIGLVGLFGFMCSVWGLYFSGNTDYFVGVVFGSLLTWFHIEVVAPKKPKIIGKKNIEDIEYTSILNKK